MSAADIQESAEVDSGFFVYRKRTMLNGIQPQKAMVYAPWGVFKNHQQALQDLLEDPMNRNMDLSSMGERMVLAEDLPWSSLKRAGEDFGLLEAGIWPLVSREQRIGSVIFTRTKPVRGHLTVETGTALLDACAAQISLALDLILTGRIAEEASQRDLLTGLLNRRGLEARLPQFLRGQQDNAHHVVFGLIDLDDLKVVNDTHGHPAGDEALRTVADIITRSLYPNDLVARFGGDEFAVVMRTETANADLEMTRIMEAVERESTAHSVSVGGALWDTDGSSLGECYRIADARLYECKRLSKVTSCDFVPDRLTPM